MGKASAPRALPDNEAKAVARMLRVSPQKLNLVAGLIRGKKVATALADLEFSRKRIAVDVRKCLESAIARSAGTYAQIVGRDQGYVILRLNSGEQRLVHGGCFATVGAVSNPDHMNTSIGKAGRQRWLGRRPHNRGVTMNPIDHPHGGGEGRTSGGRHPVTPWGKPTKGKKTRSNKRTDTFIVTSRHQRKKK